MPYIIITFGLSEYFKNQNGAIIAACSLYIYIYIYTYIQYSSFYLQIFPCVYIIELTQHITASSLLKNNRNKDNDNDC